MLKRNIDGTIGAITNTTTAGRTASFKYEITDIFNKCKAITEEIISQMIRNRSKTQKGTTGETLKNFKSTYVTGRKNINVNV